MNEHYHEGGSVVIKEVPIIKVRRTARTSLFVARAHALTRTSSLPPQEVIKEVRVEVPKIVHVPVEVIKEVIREVPVERIVERIVEKIVEVPPATLLL